MNQWKIVVRNAILAFVFVTVMIVAFDVVRNGVHLRRTPKAEDVVKVIVSYPDFSQEEKEFTDSENITLACNMVNFLRYTLFDMPDQAQEKLVTVTYVLENGESVSVSANKTTVWWEGMSHVLSEQETFILLTEGIFFADEADEQ